MSCHPDDGDGHPGWVVLHGNTCTKCHFFRASGSQGCTLSKQPLADKTYQKRFRTEGFICYAVFFGGIFLFNDFHGNCIQLYRYQICDPIEVEPPNFRSAHVYESPSRGTFATHDDDFFATMLTERSHLCKAVGCWMFPDLQKIEAVVNWQLCQLLLSKSLTCVPYVRARIYVYVDVTDLIKTKWIFPGKPSRRL